MSKLIEYRTISKLKSKLYILALISLLIQLMSCKVGEKYSTPDMDVPSQFYTGNQQDTTSIMLKRDSLKTADLQWRQFFKDSTLVNLIDVALKNNITLKKAIHEMEIQSENLKQAKVNNLPSLNASGGYIREYFSENYYGSPSSSYYGERRPPSSFYVQKQQHYLNLRSSWEIDVWGKFSLEREASLAYYKESIEFKKLVQTYIVSEIAASYYNLLLLGSQLEIALSNLELNDNTLRILNLQYTAGEVTTLAVQQVESQRLRAEILIPQIERRYVIEENYLNSLLGRFPEEIPITQNLNDITAETLYSAGIPMELLSNRPDVAGAEYSLIAEYALTGIANAMRYPSIVINGAVGLDALNIENILNPVGSGLALLNGAIFQPIFQNRRLKTAYEVAKKEREIAFLDFKETMITAVGEVSNSLVIIEKLQNEYEISEQRLQITQKSVNDASLLFNSGLANYLEVLTAQSNALESELNLANVKMQILLANVDLYRNLGGGWQ